MIPQGRANLQRRQSQSSAPTAFRSDRFHPLSSIATAHLWGERRRSPGNGDYGDRKQPEASRPRKRGFSAVIPAGFPSVPRRSRISAALISLT
ncbi:hypothetical protein SKAU_G00364360 [Synaphobranchus kaupii]|uniref:Uncharacterized protein n=1 Tax=Synaphobranchus kaupii TaxID=118154 RepID=A0A9Q1IED5_SYNKA|nr:hypothetical protein SKAU_G00364360 [Synaphobranchus kaupii]